MTKNIHIYHYEYWWHYVHRQSRRWRHQEPFLLTDVDFAFKERDFGTDQVLRMPTKCPLVHQQEVSRIRLLCQEKHCTSCHFATASSGRLHCITSYSGKSIVAHWPELVCSFCRNWRIVIASVHGSAKYSFPSSPVTIASARLVTYWAKCWDMSSGNIPIWCCSNGYLIFIHCTP